MNLWKEWHRISNKIRTWTFFISLRTQKSEATSISHVSNLTHPSWLVDHFQTSSMLMLLHRTCRWIKCYLFGGSNLANTNFTNQPLIDTFPSYITYWLIPSLPIKTYWLMPSLPIRTYWLMPSPNQNKKKKPPAVTSLPTKLFTMAPSRLPIASHRNWPKFLGLKV